MVRFQTDYLLYIKEKLQQGTKKQTNKQNM